MSPKTNNSKDLIPSDLRIDNERVVSNQQSEYKNTYNEVQGMLKGIFDNLNLNPAPQRDDHLPA